MVWPTRWWRAKETQKACAAYKRALAIYENFLAREDDRWQSDGNQTGQLTSAAVAMLYQVWAMNPTATKYLGMLIADEKNAAPATELAKIHAGLKNMEKAEAAFKDHGVDQGKPEGKRNRQS